MWNMCHLWMSKLCVACHAFYHGGDGRFSELFSQPTAGRYFCQCVFAILPDEHHWMLFVECMCVRDRAGLRGQWWVGW